MLKLVCIDPCSDPRWLQLVQQQPSSVFHSSSWLRVLAQTYDFDICAYLLLDETGAPQAGIPFGHIKDLRGERLVSLPFSDYCDPLVNSLEQWQMLSQPLLALQLALTIRCLHNELPLGDPRLTLINKAKWHGINLQLSLDKLWSHIHSSARRAIHKAQASNVKVYAAQQADDLRAFFAMHLEVRKRKYHMLAQPYHFFENIWHQFIEQQQGVVLMAMQGDRIIGATLFLEWKGVLYYKFNASALDQLHLRPNDLIIWEAIQYAKVKGYSQLDFGLSDWDQEGLVRYKRKFATDEKTISFLHYQPHQALQQEKDLQNLLSELTRLFTDECTPDPLTEAAGKLLYKLFS